MMRLVIVGNGASVLCNKNGKFIDECDHVIRINKWPGKGYEEYIGKKRDIYCSWNGRYNRCNVDFLSTFNEFWVMENKNDFNTYNVSVEVLQYLHQKQTHYLSEIDIVNLKNEINYDGPAMPSTGFCAIYKCLELYSNADIYITGFDSYIKSGWFWDVSGPRAAAAAGGGREGHPFLKEYSCLKKYIKSGKIKQL